MDRFKAFAIHFLCFFLYILLYIQFGVSEKAWNNMFLLIQKQPPEIFWEKNIFLVISPRRATLFKIVSDTGVFQRILRIF